MAWHVVALHHGPLAKALEGIHLDLDTWIVPGQILGIMK